MEKFWWNQDLVEELLHFLDLPSMVALASVHSLSLSLIQRDVMWQAVLLKTFKSKSKLSVKGWEVKMDLLLDLMDLMDSDDDGHPDDHLDDGQPDDGRMVKSVLQHIFQHHWCVQMGVGNRIRDIPTVLN